MREKKQNYTNKLNWAVVSPSANNIDEKDKEKLIEKAEKFLKENSIKPIYGRLFNSKKSYLSGTEKDRAHELMQAFLNPEIDSIISSQGGDNSNDLLPYINYKLIKLNNKPFFGLSDITVLLNVIAIKSKIITYHGIDFLWGLGKNSKEYTQKILTSITKEKKIKLLKNPHTPKWKIIKKGRGKGVMLGGCLPSFCLLLGTKYDPIIELNKEFILFLEDIGQSKSEIQSLLTQIKLHKKFELCKGIILGSFFFCEQKPSENDDSIESIAKRVFKNNKIPIIRIEEIGHCVENMIIPVGAKMEIISKEKAKIKFT